MKNKHYTIMVVPSATSKIKKVKLSAAFFRAFLGVMGLFLICSSVFTWDYVRVKKQVAELDTLRRETREQRLKINSFAQQIIDIEKEMARVRKFDAMLRVVFDQNKGPVSPGKKVGGIGGSTDMELAEYPELLEGRINELNDQIEKDLQKLKSETFSREASLSELVSFVQEQRSLLLATPSIWPVRGLITSAFERREDPFTGRVEKHLGIDIATNEGTPIVAPADGMVTSVGRTVGFGKIFSVDHGYGYATLYGHSSRVVVKEGQRIKRGQVVAYVGSTGKSTGPHLHYQIYKNGVPVNPQEFILN